MAYEALPLDILPGIFKEASEYAAQGRYTDGDNVRFWKGFPERIGGNTSVTTDAVFRPARGVSAWRALDGSQLMAFGHARGVQVLQGGTLYDVSPTGTNGYSTLTVVVGAITGGPYQTNETVTTANGATGTLIQASAASPLYVSGDNGTLKIALSGISGTFATGDTVTATGGGTARVIIGGSSSPIYVYDNTGTFTGTLTGANSGATGTITATTVLWTGTLTGWRTFRPERKLRPYVDANTQFAAELALHDIHILRTADGFSDGRTVEAYAAVFDTPTEITDQHGHYMEEIERSAFNRTLSHGAVLRSAVCLYNHGFTAGGARALRSLAAGEFLCLGPAFGGAARLASATNYLN